MSSIIKPPESVTGTTNTSQNLSEEPQIDLATLAAAEALAVLSGQQPPVSQNQAPVQQPEREYNVMQQSSVPGQIFPNYAPYQAQMPVLPAFHPFGFPPVLMPTFQNFGPQQVNMPVFISSYPPAAPAAPVPTQVAGDESTQEQKNQSYSATKKTKHQKLRPKQQLLGEQQRTRATLKTLFPDLEEGVTQMLYGGVACTFVKIHKNGFVVIRHPKTKRPNKQINIPVNRLFTLSPVQQVQPTHPQNPPENLDP